MSSAFDPRKRPVAFQLSSAPSQPFVPEDAPPPPNYSSRRCWAAYPEPQAHSTEADLFYVHPTCHFGSSWNASWDDEAAQAQVQELHVGVHAAAFADSCSVYAPYYRQITYGAFAAPTTGGVRQAAELAYADVADAFRHFLAHTGQRPFVVAGQCAAPLWLNPIAGRAGRRPPGVLSTPRAQLPRALVDALRSFGASEGPDHAGGALVAWQLRTEASADDSRNYLNLRHGGPGVWTPRGWADGAGPTLQVSPLTWRAHHLPPAPEAAPAAVSAPPEALAPPEAAAAASDAHLGVAAPVYEPGFHPSAIFDGSFRSRLVRIQRSRRRLTAATTPFEVVVGGLSAKLAALDLGQGAGDLHPLDYSCFWFNLRENVAQRLAAFVGRQRPRSAL